VQHSNLLGLMSALGHKRTLTRGVVGVGFISPKEATTETACRGACAMGKTSIAGYQVSNWIIALGAVIIVLLILRQ
jgi:hypothetical protein